VSLDGVKMVAVRTAPNGVVNQDTVFEFKQLAPDRFRAEYAGGRVVSGALIGRIEGERFHFRYVQLHDDGEIAGGQSTCDIERTDDGRVRLVEHFTWDSGEPGVNVLEQIA